MDHSAQGTTDIKKALQETVKLDDGRQGYIFTELPPIGLLSRWHCHICGRTISSERSLLMHLTHPVHTSNLRAACHPAAHFKKFVTKTGNQPENVAWNNTDVVPGEPIPPGMEDSIETCHIQEAFDNYKGPLIGLEYIVELVNLEDKSEPRYICLLCEKRGDPRSVMVHVTSQNHFLKYICCFFRTAGNILNLTKITPENKKGYSIAIRKIAAEIEKQYGRLKPTSAAAETFAQKKYEILRAIDDKEHFRETPTTTFVHLVTPEKLDQYNNEEEDEYLKPITKPLEDLKTQSSLSVLEKQKPFERNAPKASDKKPVQERGKGRPQQNGGKPTRTAPEVVVIDDDTDKKSLSPISSAGSVGHPKRRRSRSRSADRRRDRRSPRRERSLPRRSPPRRRRTRSRSRSPRRDYRRDSPSRRMDDRRGERSGDLARRDRLRDEIRDLEERRRREREYSLEGRRDIDDKYRRDDDRRRDRRDIYDDRDRSRDRSPRSVGRRSSPRRSPYREREPPYDDRRKSPRRRSMERRLSPELKPKDKKAEEKKRRWDKYRSELNKLEVEFENKLKYFEGRPEKHPLYNEEWKGFWNKRYKEVQQSGHDPNTYDFKPEWIVYWGKRMKEINDEEFRLKSEDLKREMNVTMSDVKGPSNDLVDISPPSSEDEKEVTVEDIKNTWKGLTGTELSGPPVSSAAKKRAVSPWEDPTPVVVQPQPLMNQPEPQQKRDVAPPVIHCLRMLSVLEHQLGSLAPRILHLLSRALGLERRGPSYCMTLLEDPEIHVFFDTVKEKMRGHLMAGVVERHLVSAARGVINVIDKMLRMNPPKSLPKIETNMFRPNPFAANPHPVPAAIPVAAPVVVPGIGMIDKMAVAQQIAGALIAQGRTDVSTEELEQLINAVVGIAQASKASLDANTSSSNFFSQLNMKNSTADSRINTILSTMIKDATGVSTADNDGAVESSGNTAEQTEDAEEEELKLKLTKFNSLPREEQQSLIALLKELEKTDPKRVEKLRKYVSVGLTKPKEEPVSDPKPAQKRTIPPKEEMKLEKRPIVSKSDEDDDDDYDFDDVVKAASEKVKTVKAKERPESVSMDLSDSQTSLMNPPVAAGVPSDFSNVFGPLRNPAAVTSAPETPAAVASTPFSLNLKNSAPEVADPSSQMSMGELPRASGLGSNIGLGNVGSDNYRGSSYSSFGGPGPQGDFNKGPQGGNRNYPGGNRNFTGNSYLEDSNNSSGPYGGGYGQGNFGGPDGGNYGPGKYTNQPGGYGGPNNQSSGGFGGPNKQTGGYGGSNNQTGGFGGPNNQTGGFGGPKNQQGGFGGPNNHSGGFGGPSNQSGSFGGPNNQSSGFGGPNNQSSGFGGPSNQSGGFGGPNNQLGGFGGSNYQSRPQFPGRDNLPQNPNRFATRSNY